MGPQTNQNQLLDTTFVVYNIHDLEQGKGEQSKEKQQAKIAADIIGPIFRVSLNTQTRQISPEQVQAICGLGPLPSPQQAAALYFFRND
ncbi:hypothetical protein AAY473_032095 [Plecturocebus cupreus]